MATNGPAITAAVTLVRAVQKATTKKWAYLAIFLAVLWLSVSTLSGLDLLPNPPKAKVAAVEKTEAPVAVATLATTTPIVSELPSKIEIPAIKLSATVADPDSTDIDVLDTALLKGAVRYPTSSNLGEAGNTIIFGHSSYLPIVHNQAFKTFDGIQNLKAGDQIMVTGNDTVYVYEVSQVGKANAQADSIPLTVAGSKLTLATCDSFGTKSDRFIVVADYVGSHPVGASSAVSS